MDVAESDDLWRAHTQALQRARVLPDDQSAADVLRTAWIEGPRFRPAVLDLHQRELSPRDRRLLVAWTWPNPYGAHAAARDVFEGVRLRAHDMGPDPETAWAHEVRLRVRDVARRLDAAAVDGEAGILTVAAGLLPNPGEARARLNRLKVAGDPLVADWLLELSRKATLVFDQQFTDLGAWAYDAVAVRSANLEAPPGAIAAIQTLASLVRQFLDSDPALAGLRRRSATGSEVVHIATTHALDPRVFHELLPAPPAPGTKYEALFTFLDDLPGGREIPVSELETHIPTERTPKARGQVSKGLPTFARKPQFWANPSAADVASLSKNPAARAWRAAGFTARPQTSGSSRTVETVRFDELPSRDLWWDHRRALRDGTFQPMQPVR